MFIDQLQLVILWRLLLAAMLGALMGLEREYIGKAAGIRTYALVSLGSALFSVLSFSIIQAAPNAINFDPGRIAAQIVVGIGFLGAGMIVFRSDKIEGLTTAAGVWASAAVGTAVGFGFYLPAIFAAFLLFLIFGVLVHFEDWLKSKRKNRSADYES